MKISTFTLKTITKNQLEAEAAEKLRAPQKQKHHQANNFFRKVLDTKGFSLIEILVALLLVSLVYAVMKTDVLTSNRQKLDDTIDSIERAIRFSIDESALRNAVVRIHFYLDKTPQEFAVEYGPNDNTVIPIRASEQEDGKDGGLKEEEEFQKRQSQFERQFNKVTEFQEDNKQFSDGVILLGMGTTTTKKFFTAKEAGMYFYPNGEKDESFYAFSTEEEMVILKVDSFGTDFVKTYSTYEGDLVGDLDNGETNERRREIAEKMFKDWVKK